MAKKHKIAVLPGDGIGKEVVPEGLKVLDAVAARFDIGFQWDHFDWSCDYYAKHGKMMPDDWRAQIGQHEAIFFGSIGWPATVPDHEALGFAVQVPPRIRSVHQFASRASDARRAFAAG